MPFVHRKLDAPRHRHLAGARDGDRGRPVPLCCFAEFIRDARAIRTAAARGLQLEEVLTLRGFNSSYYIRDELEQVTAPTLFIWGDKDAFAPPESGDEVAQRMPHARLEVIPDVGHLPWTEEPSSPQS